MVNQTEEAFGSRVGIGSVSSARERGAMGNIQPSDATNALDVLAEERNRSENNLTPKEKFPITPKIESLAEEITKDLNELKSPSTSIRPKARPGLGSSIKTSDIPKSRPKTLAPETSDRPKGRPEKSYETAIKKAIELSYILKNESLDLTKSETQYVTALGLPTTVDVSELDNAQANEILGTKTGLNQLNPKHLTTITKFMTQALGAFDPNQDVTKDNVFWCAAFLNHILTELGADTLGKGDKYNRLRAQQYENYGQEISFEDMQEGDILLYGNPKTGEIGHVGFYTGERDGDSINMLGGNQYDFFGGFVPEVNIVPRNIRDIVGVRRVTYAGDSAKIVEDQKDNNSIFRYFDADTYGASFIPTENKTYSEGGEVSNMNKQTEMAFMNQGGLKDDGMKQDPVSGNSVPNGSMANEVRDDIPAQLSEGEYVVPADVVRYYGVKHFEDIRNKAKSGLQSMEANGRIGGEPVPVGGPKAGMQQQPPTPYNTVPTQPQQQMAGGLNQGEMNELQSMMMAVGGFVEEPNNMQQRNTDPYQQQQTMYKSPIGMDTGGVAHGHPHAPNPNVEFRPTGGFSFEPNNQGLFSSDPNKGQEQTSVTLYSSDGLIVRQLNLPADQIEHDRLIAEGYTITKPTVKTGGGSRGSSDEPREVKPWYESTNFMAGEEGGAASAANYFGKSSKIGSVVGGVIGGVLAGPVGAALGAYGAQVYNISTAKAEVALRMAIGDKTGAEALNTAIEEKLAGTKGLQGAYDKANKFIGADGDLKVIQALKAAGIKGDYENLRDTKLTNYLDSLQENPTAQSALAELLGTTATTAPAPAAASRKPYEPKASKKGTFKTDKRTGITTVTPSSEVKDQVNIPAASDPLDAFGGAGPAIPPKVSTGGSGRAKGGLMSKKKTKKD